MSTMTGMGKTAVDLAGNRGELAPGIIVARELNRKGDVRAEE